MIGGKENGWQPSPEQIKNAHEQIADIEAKKTLDEVRKSAIYHAESIIKYLERKITECDQEIENTHDEEEKRHWESIKEENKIEIAKAKNAISSGGLILLTWYANSLDEQLSRAQSELRDIDDAQMDPEDSPDF